MPNKEEIIRTMKTALDNNKKKYTDVGLNAVYKEWETKKDDLHKLLSNHPNWDENAQAILFSTDVERPADHNTFSSKVDDLFRFYWSKNKEVTGSEDIDNDKFQIIATLRDVLGNNIGIIDDCQIDFIKEVMINNGYPKLAEKIKSGKKESRILGDVFTEFGLRDYFGTTDNGYGKEVFVYDRLFAAISDSLNPLVVKRFTLLSIHPTDYLLMSNGASHGTGKSPWRSCHNIRDGGYMTGCLSYMLDDCSAVLYTVDKTFDGRDYCLEGKINRQMYMIKKGTMIASRIYPDPNDSALQTSFRNTVQEILAACNNLPNYWDTMASANADGPTYWNTENGATHYPDYSYSQFNGKVCLLRGADHPVLNIGAWAIGIIGGDKFNSTSFGLYGKMIVCDHCGEIIKRDEAIYDDRDGKYYCKKCVTKCACCGRIIFISDSTVKEGDRYFCESCVDDYFVSCADCGKKHYRENMIRVNGKKHVCLDCFTSNPQYHRCSNCGSAGDEKFLILTEKYNGKKYWFCKKCLDKFMKDDLGI